MKIEKIYSRYLESGLVDTDTRKIRNNSLFFALKGANFDGNKFVLEALKKGAKYAISDDSTLSGNDRIIIVKNVLTTLQCLARYHRDQLNIPVLGLTGSNGKTTTKELISAVLSTKFKTVATKGNLNNHIGVPLTILSIPRDTEMAIVEMGANHLKEIEDLCTIARPSFGYITNFGKAHLEGFGSEDGVIQGKSELYDSLRQNNGIAFINYDDKVQIEKSKGLEIQLIKKETMPLVNTKI
jgi:UDP-N-acetylmuramoyl-tripeptide--D-alanyl-D-alanine ligase